MPPRWRRWRDRASVAGARRHPHRLGHRRAASEVRRLRRGAHATDVGTAGTGPAVRPDILGSSEEIAEALYADAAFREVREVVFALPFTFEHAGYVQILTDMATTLGTALGWKPRS